MNLKKYISIGSYDIFLVPLRGGRETKTVRICPNVICI